MKRVLCYLSIFYSLLFISCNDVVDEISNVKSNEVVIKDISVDENGFLIFKDQSVYQEVSSLIDKMTDQEFQCWENQIGFLSAQSFLNNVDAELALIDNQEQFDNLKNRYSGKLIFTDEGDVNLPFYATAWSRVLSPQGIMKIGDVLYKFDEEKQVTIVGGQYKDAMKTYTNSIDTSLVRLFYPYKNKDNLKSATTTLLNETVYARSGRSKLTYDLQLINYYYSGCGLTKYNYDGAIYYTEAGYELRLEMLQKRKNILGIWYKNSTIYYIKDFYFNYKYTKLMEMITLPGGTTQLVDQTTCPYECSSSSIAYQETSETSTGAVLKIFYYYNCIEGSYPQIDFDVYDLDVTFWSRGFDTDEAVTINKSYSF